MSQEEVGDAEGTPQANDKAAPRDEFRQHRSEHRAPRRRENTGLRAPFLPRPLATPTAASSSAAPISRAAAPIPVLEAATRARASSCPFRARRRPPAQRLRVFGGASSQSTGGS